MSKKTVDGRTPKEQITACYEVVRQQEIAVSARRSATARGTQRPRYRDPRVRQLAATTSTCAHFHDNIYPLITPQSIDPAHRSVHLEPVAEPFWCWCVSQPGGRTSLARIKVPTGREPAAFIQLPGRNHYVPIEEVMRSNLDMLLPEMDVISEHMFRVTRNANTERNEEHADDLLSMIESELRDRRFAPIVRMQIQGDMDETSRGCWRPSSASTKTRTYSMQGDMLAMRDLFQLVGIDIPADCTTNLPAGRPSRPGRVSGSISSPDLRERGPIAAASLRIVRHLGRALSHEAALDPKVRAIKMTLYRTSSDTQVIEQPDPCGAQRQTGGRRRGA